MLFCTVYIVFFLVKIGGSLSGSLEDSERPLVKTELGVIKGQHKQSYKGRTFSAFEGIPYAKPPIGNLRFKEPQDAQPWSGIWDATTLHECIQLNLMIVEVVGNEDCLYLNVYVPKSKPLSADSLDVIVYIHGGAFMIGYAELFGPEYLMDRDVICVSLNYRLNVLGFLSTEDEVVPGNNGLKDQRLALQWIKRNIQQFGDNPQSVTIVGTSAGAAAVHLHFLSSLSKGLFHRGFSQSGTALSPWAFQQAPLEKTRRMALSVGCNSSSTQRIIECMRGRSARQLVENTKQFEGYSWFPIAPFGPVIEKKSETAFLTDYPYHLLSNGQVNDVPWMTSVIRDEGLLFIMSIHNKLNEIDEQWNTVLPHILDYNYTVSDSDRTFIATSIKEFYFSSRKLTQDNIQKLIKLIGDRYFMLGFERSSRIQAKVTKSPVYSFLYGYNADHSFSKPSSLNFSGVTHGDDTYLLYPAKFDLFTRLRKLLPEKLSEADELIKEFFLNVLTSFATHGKPEVQGISWQQVSSSADFGYLCVDTPTQIKMAFTEELAPTGFWDALPIMEAGKVVPAKAEL